MISNSRSVTTKEYEINRAESANIEINNVDGEVKIRYERISLESLCDNNTMSAYIAQLMSCRESADRDEGGC